MNKTWLGVIGTAVVVLLIVLLFGGTRISCRESFWDKNKQVIEIEHP
jgi:CDP-diglyceride synthetase